MSHPRVKGGAAHPPPQILICLNLRSCLHAGLKYLFFDRSSAPLLTRRLADMCEGCAQVGKYLMKSGKGFMRLSSRVLSDCKKFGEILDWKQCSKWPCGPILLPLMCSQEEHIDGKRQKTHSPVAWKFSRDHEKTPHKTLMTQWVAASIYTLHMFLFFFVFVFLKWQKMTWDRDNQPDVRRVFRAGQPSDAPPTCSASDRDPDGVIWWPWLWSESFTVC